MTRYDANTLKDGRTAQKPATMELRGELIEATHHITNERDTLLHLYLSCRSDGIDITVPLESNKPAYARSERGRRALGFTDDVEADKQLVADGGCYDVFLPAYVKNEFCEHVLDMLSNSMLVSEYKRRYVSIDVRERECPECSTSHEHSVEEDEKRNMRTIECSVCGHTTSDKMGDCDMDGCDRRLADCEVPVQGYCGPVHAQEELYDGDFALDTADVAGFHAGDVR